MTRWTEQDLANATGRVRAGYARAASLTAERRREIASLGGQTRWKNHKYHAQETFVDGIRFPSQREAEYYGTLKLRKAAGDIKGFTRQVSVPLASGKRRLRIDFVVIELDDRVRWIDTKGAMTEAWAVKRDELEHNLGIRIELA